MVDGTTRGSWWVGAATAALFSGEGSIEMRSNAAAFDRTHRADVDGGAEFSYGDDDASDVEAAIPVSPAEPSSPIGAVEAMRDGSSKQGRAHVSELDKEAASMLPPKSER